MKICRNSNRSKKQLAQMTFWQNSNRSKRLLAKMTVFLSFPPQWGGFISFFTLQLQLLIAILQLPMLVVVFFLAKMTFCQFFEIHFGLLYGF
jgi:hypothetical protein